MEGHQFTCTHDEEVPPFAIVDQKVPQHLFVHRKEEFRCCAQGVSESKLPARTACSDISQTSSTSSPPGLCESALSSSSASASASACYPDNTQGNSQHLSASSTFLISSLPTIVSNIGDSTRFRQSDGDINGVSGELEPGRQSLGRSSRGSIGFSQLMLAADDTKEPPIEPFCPSRMPMVPEEEPSGSDSLHSGPTLGALITSAPHLEESIQEGTHRDESGWFPPFLRTGHAREQNNLSMSTPLLSYSPSSSSSLAHARAGISSRIIDDESFEVIMDVQTPATIQAIVGVIANPEMLRFWCDPIKALVITSSSEGAQQAARKSEDREYEGEWIEATTGSLASPPSSASCLFSAGRVCLETLGYSSYGKVTMFVERRRGQVGLTVGPFAGGISASHTIFVHEQAASVRVVDRVRLTHDDGSDNIYPSLFFCGVADSLNRCLLPSVAEYMEQVATSMARLRLLVENGPGILQPQIMDARGDSGLVVPPVS